MITDTRINIWRTETRPSTEVPFWDKTPEDENYLESTYKEAGLFISETITFSDDQLSRTRAQLWNRVPGIVNELLQDADLADQTARNIAHNDENGITRTVAHYEIIAQDDTVLVTGNIAE